MSVMCRHFDDIDPKSLKSNFQEMLDDAKFEDYTRMNTTDTKIVEYRLKLVKKRLMK